MCANITKLKLSLCFKIITEDVQSGGLVVKSLDSQSRGSVFKTTGWLQGLSSFQGR